MVAADGLALYIWSTSRTMRNNCARYPLAMLAHLVDVVAMVAAAHLVRFALVAMLQDWR